MFKHTDKANLLARLVCVPWRRCVRGGIGGAAGCWRWGNAPGWCWGTAGSGNPPSAGRSYTASPAPRRGESASAPAGDSASTQVSRTHHSGEKSGPLPWVCPSVTEQDTIPPIAPAELVSARHGCLSPTVCVCTGEWERITLTAINGYKCSPFTTYFFCSS